MSTITCIIIILVCCALGVLALLVGTAAWMSRSKPQTPTQQTENPYRPIYPRKTPHLK